MDEHFYEIYSEIALEFHPGVPVRRLWFRSRYVRANQLAYRAVKIASRDVLKGKALRPDAELFLIANLSLMVARPLLHPDVRGSDNEQYESELAEMMRADAREVIASAVSDNRAEVSAASIVRALSESLGKLRLANWRLWDRVEGHGSEHY